MAEVGRPRRAIKRFENEEDLPTNGPESCGDLGFFVRRDVNLEVGQGVEVVELPPVLFSVRYGAQGGILQRGV